MQRSYGDWLDLIRETAGETIYNRGVAYQRQGRVHDLASTAGGAFVAWVHGTARYATTVTLTETTFSSLCTCPYEDVCKHEVAVALEIIYRSRNAPPLPVADPTDPRLMRLQRFTIEHGVGVLDTHDIREYLAGLTKADLVDLLAELATKSSDVYTALVNRQLVSSGNTAALEADLRRKIQELDGEWYGDDWDEPHLPDITAIADGLRQLRAAGDADAVQRLGQELFDYAPQVIEQIHDEGELSSDIQECMGIVFEALPETTMPPEEQILWAMNLAMNDDFDLANDVDVVLSHSYPAAVWSKVADTLLGNGQIKRNQFGDDQHIAYTGLALERAGRNDEVIPLWERAAETNGSYVQLVSHLIAAGRNNEAETWARKGIVAVRDTWPGMATSLSQQIQTIRAGVGDWPMVAALRAEQFFSRPSFEAYTSLSEAASKAGVAEPVRGAALRFLATGLRPHEKAKNHVPVSWPLPDNGITPQTIGNLRFPQVLTLITIAIHEERPDDVVHWYEQRGATWTMGHMDDRVATALADTLPDRAAEIWQQLAEMHILQTNTSHYEQAIEYLRKLRTLWISHMEAERWDDYLGELQMLHRRKRRLMELLDTFRAK